MGTSTGLGVAAINLERDDTRSNKDIVVVFLWGVISAKISQLSLCSSVHYVVKHCLFHYVSFSLCLLFILHYVSFPLCVFFYYVIMFILHYVIMSLCHYVSFLLCSFCMCPFHFTLCSYMCLFHLRIITTRCAVNEITVEKNGKLAQVHWHSSENCF